MKFKIVAGLLVVVLGFLVLQARAQTHNHTAHSGGLVVMFGNGDHAEISKMDSKLSVRMSDSNRKAYKISDFEILKLELLNEDKSEALKKDKKSNDSEILYSLPSGDLSKVGVKVTVKRKSTKENAFSQAIPFSKIP